MTDVEQAWKPLQDAAKAFRSNNHSSASVDQIMILKDQMIALKKAEVALESLCHLREQKITNRSKSIADRTTAANGQNVLKHFISKVSNACDKLMLYFEGRNAKSVSALRTTTCDRYSAAESKRTALQASR